MAIDMVKIRARIVLGNIVALTPTSSSVRSVVRSFNVTKARGQVSSFSAVLKVPHDDARDNIVGSNIEIYAGEGSPNIKIFTGMVKQARISPCWDDPYYVDLSISGVDRLFHLQNKKFTRRCRSSWSTWVAINGVTRPGLKAGKFKYTQDSIEVTDGNMPQEDHLTRPLSTVKTEVPSKDSKIVSILVQPENIRNPETSVA